MGVNMEEKGCIGQLPIVINDEEYIIKIGSAEVSSQQHEDGSADLLIEYDVFKDDQLVVLTDEILKQTDEFLNNLLKRFFDDLINVGDLNEKTTQENMD